jgi:hypothetical protein
MKHQVPESLKFKRLQRRLGVSRVVVAGTLELLWIATQKNAPRGDIGKYDDEAIAIEVDWEGEPSALIDALVETGWLDRCPTHRLVVHDWHAHAPRYIHGIVTKQGGFLTQDADYSQRLQSATTVRDCTKGQRNVTKPNQNKPLAASAACPETPRASSGPEPDEEPLLAFACDGPTPTWSLLPSHVAKWSVAYPNLDVLAECRRAWSWIDDNPERRKTAKGMRKFLGNWLGRAQDRGGNQRGSPQRLLPPMSRTEMATQQVLARHNDGDAGEDRLLRLEALRR